MGIRRLFFTLFLFLPATGVYAQIGTAPTPTPSSTPELRAVLPAVLTGTSSPASDLYVAAASAASTYFPTANAITGGWVDSTFPTIDWTKDAYTDTSSSNLVMVDLYVYSVPRPGVNQYVIVALEATLQGGGSSVLVPIAATDFSGSMARCVDQVNCQNNGSNPFPVPTAVPIANATPNPVVSPASYSAPPDHTVTTADYPFFGARFPTGGNRLRIGFYPKDICWIASQQGSRAIGCDTGVGGNAALVDLLTPTNPSNQVTRMELKLRMYVAAGPNTNQPAYQQTPTDFDLNVILENTAGTVSCLMSNSAYFPSDGGILWDSNSTTVSLSPTPNSAISQTDLVVSTAPAAYELIVAKKQTGAAAMPGTSSTNYAANDVVAVIPYDANQQLISGFTNVVDGNFTNGTGYTLAVTTRDHAGIYSDFLVPAAAGTGTVNSCCLGSGCSSSENDVFAAPIQTFLNRSKCFIATAAYRSVDAAPVRMLREFRDQILLKQSWGKKFVRWYYEVSPPAAEWLIDHEVFRYPVLILLAPVEAIAWTWLHGGMLGVAGLLVFGLLANLWLLRALILRSRKRGRKNELS